MDRLKIVQEYVDGILLGLPDRQMQAVAFRHLYGVSQFCTLLAMKRGEDAELAAISGMLHDLYSYKASDRDEHAHKGAAFAREILGSLGVFSEQEIKIVAQAVYIHSDKDVTGSALDEILKDADVLHHCLSEPFSPVAEKEKARFLELRKELGMDSPDNGKVCRKNEKGK